MENLDVESLDSAAPDLSAKVVGWLREVEDDADLDG
jgi:hypothetical protein